VSVAGYPAEVAQGVSPDDKSYYDHPGAGLGDGKYYWKVETEDYAQNASGYTAENWLWVDKTAPAVPVLVSPVGGVEIDQILPDLDWQPVADARKFYLEVYDATDALLPWCPKTILQPSGDVSHYQLVAGEELAEGAYTWQVKSEDYATNQSSFCTPEAFTVSLIPEWPAGWTELAKHVPGTVGVKDGGWLVTATPADAQPKVYVAKGNKTAEFYVYDPVQDTWGTLAPIEPDEGGRTKLPKKGCTAAADGVENIYMTKGNNTLGFWKYSISANTWTRLPDVPLGAGKKVKGGGDLAYVAGVTDEESSYVYLLKGYGTEFYRFNTASSRWDTLANAPYGVAPKYNMGSFLVYDGSGDLYAHQAKYTNTEKTHHYMYKYDLGSRAWVTETGAKGMPVAGMDGGKLKLKKSKDGGSGAWYDGSLYALKGGNTCQFYKYLPAPGDTWTELDTIKSFGSTAKKKKVKAGGDLTSYGYGAFFALKGNKTNEFWRYVVPTADRKQDTGNRAGVMAGPSTIYDVRFSISPNPLMVGFATIRYAMPKPGPMSVSVLDVAGRSVFRQSAIGNRSSTMSLDLRNLSNGVYLVRLDADGYSHSQKLVVQR